MDFLKTVQEATAQLDAGWRSELGFPSLPVLTHGSLLVKVYAPRGKDPQQPHTRGENYVVARGNGDFVCGEQRKKFSATDLLLEGKLCEGSAFCGRKSRSFALLRMT